MCWDSHRWLTLRRVSSVDTTGHKQLLLPWMVHKVTKFGHKLSSKSHKFSSSHHIPIRWCMWLKWPVLMKSPLSISSMIALVVPLENLYPLEIDWENIRMRNSKKNVWHFSNSIIFQMTYCLVESTKHCMQWDQHKYWIFQSTSIFVQCIKSKTNHKMFRWFRKSLK